MTLMSKTNKILIGVLLLVYIIALVVFHATYEYTVYWEDETPIIVRYSMIYIVIGLIVFFAFNRKTLNWKALSKVTIKDATKIVAYTCAIKAFLCICPILFEQAFSSIIPFVHMAAWVAISVFFFTLHKNMR